MNLHLEMKKVSKGFGNSLLYANVSFTFQPGCYAIVGPNGVGKTVLLDMLAGTSTPDTGHITLSNAGANFSIAYKRRLAYIPSKPDFFPAVTGHQFLNFISSVNGCTTSEFLCQTLVRSLNLEPYLQTRFSDMSLGTQKKLFLATLGIGAKSLFVLDEPTNGLDREACKYTADFLSLAAQQSIVILATHDQTLLRTLNPTIIQLTSTPITHFQLTHMDKYQHVNTIL
jgi:ABC-2 type transport system ATP-binding protein